MEAHLVREHQVSRVSSTALGATPSVSQHVCPYPSITAVAMPTPAEAANRAARIGSLTAALLGQNTRAPEAEVVHAALSLHHAKFYDSCLKGALQDGNLFPSPLGPDPACAGFELIERVSDFVRSDNDPDLSVDDVARAVLGGEPTTSEAWNRARQAVFCCIGFVSFLYMPKLDSPSDILEIDTTATPKVQNPSVQIWHAKTPIDAVMRRFEELFPSPTPDGTLYSSRLSFYSLHRVSGIKIRWVETLNSHLLLDASQRELLLFRFPSACLLYSRRTNMPSAFHWLDTTPAASWPLFSKPLAANASTDKPVQPPSILRGFNDLPLPGITAKVPTHQFLKEVLLSYRLLFGQDKKSRKLFGAKRGPGEAAARDHLRDPFLERLCQSKRLDVSRLDVTCHFERERRSYEVAEDFPLLGRRLLVLQEFNMRQDSTTLREFWSDRRNPFNFYTFWAVIVFGAISIVLSLLQSGLSIAQLVYAVKQFKQGEIDGK
ncbi:hypothetical protein MAPG_08756 [Magnaporthiopsis poae ATCC 64411]|uniref:Uncharacterized protein n=1 Tax=Magnaporthiopsis poae (strain ATCC 64411 / 73-15) TaxID=644358 RepID=A0A0C4E866_MAGP6|nr:hypothetical protein MAPG_08756 [Magnaporthiopsis poae ATCC 64411]